MFPQQNNLDWSLWTGWGCIFEVFDKRNYLWYHIKSYPWLENPGGIESTWDTESTDCESKVLYHGQCYMHFCFSDSHFICNFTTWNKILSKESLFLHLKQLYVSLKCFWTQELIPSHSSLKQITCESKYFIVSPLLSYHC